VVSLKLADKWNSWDFKNSWKVLNVSKSESWNSWCMPHPSWHARCSTSLLCCRLCASSSVEGFTAEHQDVVICDRPIRYRKPAVATTKWSFYVWICIMSLWLSPVGVYRWLVCCQLCICVLCRNPTNYLPLIYCFVVACCGRSKWYKNFIQRNWMECAPFDVD